MTSQTHASRHFADRLQQAIADKKSPAVVALDPVHAHLPKDLVPSARADASNSTALAAILEYSRRVIDLIAPLIPAVKINSAYFERYHAEGVAAYDALIGTASDRGLIVIGDVKRGDVGHTAEMYAAAQLADLTDATGSGLRTPDAVTVNGYLGIDGVRPFIDVAVREDKGVFVLVRTSNPSAAVIQDAPTADGRKVHEIVAGEVAKWAEEARTIGLGNYSCVGAVAATRDAQDAARLRALMPRCVFLVPGYGAQGGKAEDFRPYFKADGRGAIIAAGRSVIYAYERSEYRGAGSWERAVEAACRDFVRDLQRALPTV